MIWRWIFFLIGAHVAGALLLFTFLFSFLLLLPLFTQLFLLLSQVLASGLIPRDTVVGLVESVSRRWCREILHVVLLLMHLIFTALLDAVNAFARLLVRDAHCSFPFISEPIFLLETFIVYSSEPGLEVKTIINRSMIILSILLELHLVKVAESVSLFLFMLEHPVVWQNGRVCWEAPLQIAQFVSINFVAVLLVLEVLVVDGVGGQGVVLLVRDVLGEDLLVVMVVCIAWLVVEDVALLRVRFQVQSWHDFVHPGPRMNQICQG